VILTRNIFDVVPSIRDHWMREGSVGLGNYVHADWFRLNSSQQYTSIIKLILPWYFHFYVSWLDATAAIETVWITYEELFADQLGTVKEVLKFYNLRRSDQTILQAIDAIPAQETRFNKGVSGRGRQVLTTSQVAEIYAMAKCCGVSIQDFRRMGIDGSDSESTRNAA
jgi:hypothetical protein